MRTQRIRHWLILRKAEPSDQSDPLFTLDADEVRQELETSQG